MTQRRMMAKVDFWTIDKQRAGIVPALTTESNAMRFRHIYHLLHKAGHTGAKACEIILSASRKDKHARQWIAVCFAQRHDC